MGFNIGLDFGTSNSGVAVSDGQAVNLLPIDPQNVMPEVVKTILYVTREYRHFIGQEAIELYYKHNVNRIRRYEQQWAGEIEVVGGDMYFVRDVFVEVDVLKPGRLLQYLKTALRKGATSGGIDGTLMFERYYTTGDLVQAYLKALKARAEDILGGEISSVTLGRPVKFAEDPEQDHQSEQTLRKAALDAGFDEVHLEFEPVAAALFYEKLLNQPQNALIFDFGGGTLDIAIMRLGDPAGRQIYANGGVDIAGSDFDRTIIEKRLLPHFGWGKVHHRPEITDLIEAVSDWAVLPDLSTPIASRNLEKAILAEVAPVQLQNLQALIFDDLAFEFYNRVEAAKIALSNQGSTVIEIKGDQIDVWELYTRAQFEADIAEYREHIKNVLLDTLLASGLKPKQIDAVVKTGGSSNIPIFSEMLGQIFGPEKLKESNAFSSVTAGLAIRAYEQTGQAA